MEEIKKQVQAGQYTFNFLAPTADIHQQLMLSSQQTQCVYKLIPGGNTLLHRGD